MDSQKTSFECDNSSFAYLCHYYVYVCRFCKLLGYSEEQLFTAVALSCAKSNQMDKAREICRQVKTINV